MLKFFTKSNLLILISIFTLSTFLRFYYFYHLDSWFDEWNMIYTVDPNITNEQTWKRFFGDRGDHVLPEYYPPINAFVLKYFLKFTGYYTENARIYSLIFGCLSTLLVHILYVSIAGNKKNYLAVFLFSINLFLIWQSSEIRPHTFVLFFSLLNIILFIHLINKKHNNFFITFYIGISVLMLSSWPFTLTIFFGKTLYIFIHRNIKKISLFKFFLIFFTILCLYIFFNYDYLVYHLQRNSHYTILKLSFFVNFHFRSFFGSIFMGAIFLILFAFIFIKYIKKNIQDEDNSNILFYIIISSYFLTILYSIFKAGVISPKYLIFVLPLIIVWISHKIKYLKFDLIITILLIFFNLINTSYLFFKNPIDRPPFKKVINIISESDSLNVATVDSLVFMNAFKSYKAFSKNKLVLTDLRSGKIDKEKFWFLCKNNPRFEVGNEIKPTEEKCKIMDNRKDFKEIKNINIEDFILKQFVKNE
jgi:4-amino-4-deoxy-L-arabinose transferase-like glycosyltransferase